MQVQLSQDMNPSALLSITGRMIPAPKYVTCRGEKAGTILLAKRYTPMQLKSWSRLSSELAKISGLCVEFGVAAPL